MCNKKHFLFSTLSGLPKTSFKTKVVAEGSRLARDGNKQLRCRFGKEGSERTFAAHPFDALFTVSGSKMTSQFEVRIDLPKKTSLF